MKVRVVRKFIGKDDGTLHKVGDELEITEKRYTEILKTGKFVEKLADTEQTSKAKKTVVK